MIAVIAGASGLVGSHLLQKLFDSKEFTKVISVSRKPLHLQNPKLQEVLVSDFSNLLKYTGELKGDVYFCCLGTTIKKAGSQENFRKVDHDAILEFGKIAEHHQAHKFVLISAAGASPKSTFFYNKVKGETERDLRTLDFKSLIIFRPSLLVGDRKESRPAEKIFIDLAKAVGPLLPVSLRKPMMTPVEDLTQKMLDTGLHANGNILVFGPKDI